MTEPSGRRRIRGFLANRKHKHKRQLSDPEDLLSASASITNSVTSQPESAAVAMEGNLKKRLAKMPVMHDRYCVASWETDAKERKHVVLRSYKSHKAYEAHPEKPSSVHQLKRIRDWDGKTGFHRYQHAFTMEMKDAKMYQCVAPCVADKRKWLELMAGRSALKNGRKMRLGSGDNPALRRRAQSAEFAASSIKPRSYTDVSVAQSDVNDDQSTDADDLDFPGHDRLFRATSGASANSVELPNDDKNEPVDWGLCGNEDTTAEFEVQEDLKPVLLDKELLRASEENKTLATDSFLFEEAGASRFGAVVVEGAGKDDEDDDVEFIDEDFAAREAQKENEKKMKRRAQKLESNRDLYAEMAAARLAGMRKDARHSKKRHSQSRHSTVSDESDLEIHEDDLVKIVDGEIEDVGELEDTHQRRSSFRSRRSSKGDKRSCVKDGFASDEDVNVEEEEDEAVALAVGVSSQTTKSKSAETEAIEADVANAEGAETEVVEADVVNAESAEAEELRRLKKKYRAERREKKRLMREKEEEERTAMKAAELAQIHREEQRAREEAKAREKQEKRDKKERREMKEKLKREKSKQRQTESELRKLVELKQTEEERLERERREKKEKKEKKSKKKAKYTSPAERITRKEERDAERAAEAAAAADQGPAVVSSALVVVEKSADTKLVTQSVATPEPITASASPPLSSQTEAAPTQRVVSPAAPSTTSASANVAAPVGSFASAAEGAATATQAMPVPMYQMSPPPFVPSYPTGPQSMPAYGLAATFGAYYPFYPAPYSYGGPVGPQPALMRPTTGFVAGLSAMKSFGVAAGPAPAPSTQDSDEPMIGPQLPTPEERAGASSAGASAPSYVFPPLSSGKSAGPKLINLPELPDVIEF